mmetsp:Transcript_24118/g.57088  ORF Transcript_24118/g.57088 Transcript_24118/m.57088 type:complete len:402 (+) Transcript_24118:608-1813(+)
MANLCPRAELLAASAFAELAELAADLSHLLDDGGVPQRAESQQHEARVGAADGEDPANHREVGHLLTAGGHALRARALVQRIVRANRHGIVVLPLPFAGHAARQVALVHGGRPRAHAAGLSLSPGLVDAREVGVVAAPLPHVPVAENVPSEVGHDERGGDHCEHERAVVVAETTTADTVLQSMDHEAVNDDHQHQRNAEANLVTNLPGCGGDCRAHQSRNQGRPTSRADQRRDAHEEGADADRQGAALRLLRGGVLGLAAEKRRLRASRRVQALAGRVARLVAATHSRARGLHVLPARRVRAVVVERSIDRVEHLVQLLVLVQEAVAVLLAVDFDAVDDHVEVAGSIGVRGLDDAHTGVRRRRELLQDIFGRGFIPRPVASPAAVADHHVDVRHGDLLAAR